MKRRITIFTCLVLLITWVPSIWLMASGGAANAALRGAMFALFMLLPAVASLLTRLLTHEGFREMKLGFHFRGKLRVYLAAWFGPALLIGLGALVYFVLFPAQFDPNATALAAASGIEPAAMRGVLLSQIAVGVLLGPLLNAIPALGEELGWRGYLLPRLLQTMSPRKAILTSGVIWGIWHAPMIAMGHNYGTGYFLWPWTGIAAMTLFCVAIGAFFAWIAIKADSVWPCAFAHAGLNAVASTGAYFTIGMQVNPFVGPLPTGILGGIGFLLLAVVLYATTDRWMPKPATEEVLG